MRLIQLMILEANLIIWINTTTHRHIISLCLSTVTSLDLDHGSLLHTPPTIPPFPVFLNRILSDISHKMSHFVFRHTHSWKSEWAETSRAAGLYVPRLLACCGWKRSRRCDNYLLTNRGKKTLCGVLFSWRFYYRHHHHHNHVTARKLDYKNNRGLTVFVWWLPTALVLNLQSGTLRWICSEN